MKYSLLLTPLQINQLNLPNRIVMPPMVTFLAKDDGLVTQAHLDHYERSAGPGLIIVEGTAVLPEGRVSKRQLGIYSDRHIDGLTQLARNIKTNGAVAAIQIHHVGATAFAITQKQKYQQLPMILFRLLKQQLMTAGLFRIQEAFQNAARRAIEAGFDIVELHGAHGYLFSQFLSPLKNWRLDQYGGSLENRRRLLLEVFRATYRLAADKALVTCRLGIADGHRRGLSLSDGLSTAALLEREGAKLLDVSCGSGTPDYLRPEKSRYSDRLHLAHRAKSVLQIPVIGGGGIRHPDLAEQALEDGMADLIYIGRGILADPSWARKTVEGKAESIVLCRGCRPCFHLTDSSRCPARRHKQN
ncbi:MAG: NADH:flavin oxidoreductase [Geobacteraceae bacterium]|nr:NADH:flavin oxidoreductase [Geobacteraceae bacterium]